MATTRALEDVEIFAIFDSIKGRHAVRNRAMLLVGIAAALRATELVSLTVGDVYNGREVKTYVTIRGETAKFGKQRTIRLGEGVRHAIREFIEWKCEHGELIDAEKPLFHSQKGGHLTRIALLQTVTRIFGKARIDQSPHALRKTGATIYYIASDYDLLATQQFLGHASPSTTRKYIGLTTEQLVNYSENASADLFNAMHGGQRAGKFITNVHMINYTEQDRQHMVSQLDTKDEQIKFLNHQVSRLTQLLWERTKSNIALDISTAMTLWHCWAAATTKAPVPQPYSNTVSLQLMPNSFTSSRSPETLAPCLASYSLTSSTSAKSTPKCLNSSYLNFVPINTKSSVVSMASQASLCKALKDVKWSLFTGETF